MGPRYSNRPTKHKTTKVLAAGNAQGEVRFIPTQRTAYQKSSENDVLVMERTKNKDTLLFIINLKDTHAQYTMPYDASFYRYPDNKVKNLATPYQYDMKPWEYWILSNKKLPVSSEP